MRRWLINAGLAAVVCAASAEAQGRYQYYGCDGDRSCHTVTVDLFRYSMPGIPGRPWDPSVTTFVAINGVSTFYQRGGFKNCGGDGCAWDSDVNQFLLDRRGTDHFHAGDRCWTRELGVFDPEYPSCGPGESSTVTLFAWAPDDFIPEWFTFNLSYAGDPNGYTVGLSRVVPEPTTALLLGIGVVGVGLVARRRRVW